MTPSIKSRFLWYKVFLKKTPGNKTLSNVFLITKELYVLSHISTFPFDNNFWISCTVYAAFVKQRLFYKIVSGRTIKEKCILPMEMSHTVWWFSEEGRRGESKGVAWEGGEGGPQLPVGLHPRSSLHPLLHPRRSHPRRAVRTPLKKDEYGPPLPPSSPPPCCSPCHPGQLLTTFQVWILLTFWHSVNAQWRKPLTNLNLRILPKWSPLLWFSHFHFLIHWVLLKFL